MSWSHPDDGRQAGGEMESQHKSGKPQAGKTLCGATDMSPALPRDPGRATLSFQGDFGQGSQHTHSEKQRVLGTPSSPLVPALFPAPCKDPSSQRWPTEPVPAGTDRRGTDHGGTDHGGTDQEGTDRRGI